jgi:hypothetical protein
MKRISQTLTLVLVLVLAACAPKVDVPATVAAAVEASQAALPTLTPAVTVMVEQQTVEVPVTVVVAPTETATAVLSGPETPTPAPAAAATDTPAAGAGPVNLQPVVAGGTPAVTNGGPDPLAGMAALIFDEHFTPGYFWGQGDDAASKIQIADDQLTILNKKSQTFAWTFNTYKEQNFYLQAVVSPVNCKDRDNYGVALRVKDDNNLLLFGVSCEGNYRLLQIADGNYTPLIDWTPSDYILHFNWINTVGVRAVGDKISLYVNNAYLGSATTSLTQAGRFGLYVGNVISPDLTVHFDDVTAWRVQ